MTVVGEAVDGEDAIQQAKTLTPNVVVMDISMPRCNGMQATERLKQMYPKIKVLVLSAYENIDYLRRLLKAGASGYVTKRSAAMELTRAIRTVNTGEIYLDSASAGILASDMAGRSTASDVKTGEPISPPRDGGLARYCPGLFQQGNRRAPSNQHQDGGNLQGPSDGEAQFAQPRGYRSLCFPSGVVGRELTVGERRPCCRSHCIFYAATGRQSRVRGSPVISPRTLPTCQVRLLRIACKRPKNR